VHARIIDSRVHTSNRAIARSFNITVIIGGRMSNRADLAIGIAEETPASGPE
jgi:hypothetical protein